MARPLSTEFRYYLAIWRKAWADRDEANPLTINASNYNMAVTMRQGLYRAVRPYRHGKQFDAELSAAADHFVVFLEKGPDVSAPHKIIFRQRLSLSELERELHRLGLEGDDLLLTEERDANKTLANFLPESDGPIRSNPFYSRED